MTVLIGTRNFTRSEALKASGGFIPLEKEANAQATLELLQSVRDILGKPILITSLYRSPEHNKTVPGHADGSQHLEADAADVNVVGMTNHEAAQKLMQAEKEGRMPAYHQLISYDETNHLHVGRGKARQKLVKTPTGYVAMTVAYLKKAKPGISIAVLLFVIGVFFFPNPFKA